LGFLGNPIILEFLAGVALALVLPRWNGRRAAGLAALAAAALWIAALLALGYGQVSEAAFTQSGALSLERVALFGVPAALLVAAAVLLEKEAAPGGLGRVLSRGGDASYALYLAHPGALALLIAWSPALPADALVALGIGMGLVAGALVHMGIERPLALAFKDLASRRPTITAAPSAG
jgi:peptidoglycan/LPS O-acetylase OafA/YrhL